jgi:putative transposase
MRTREPRGLRKFLSATSLVRRLLFLTGQHVALILDREAAGREASPKVDVLKSLSVRAPFAEVCGLCGSNRIALRKRNVAMHTDGRLVMVSRPYA